MSGAEAPNGPKQPRPPGPPPSADASSMTPQVTVLLNGESCRVPAGLDLEAVLRHLGHQPRLVVVEYNSVILPRARWADQRVGESDVLEVVTIVGGGS
ncbi:MAG: sulfur carrier protein ThiS [Synechococcaceae cyanobacterium]